MPYFIVKTNGSALATVEDGTVDITSTDLALLGKNYPTYGSYLNQNFVKLLENFSNVDQPDSPLTGQLWYNSNNRTLNLYREGAVENSWKKLAVIAESNIQPSESRLGDLWYDTEASQLKLFDGSSWLTIGPQTTVSGLLRIIGQNSFRVQISGAEVLTATPDGSVTKPLNPAVQATNRFGGANLTTTNITTYAIWIPANVLTDVRNNFNSSTGVFTVPTSALYRVHVNLVSLGGGNVNVRWQLNNSDYGINATANHSGSTYSTIVASGLINATQGDTISLVCSTDASASISHLNSSYSIELVQ